MVNKEQSGNRSAKKVAKLMLKVVIISFLPLFGCAQPQESSSTTSSTIISTTTQTTTTTSLSTSTSSSSTSISTSTSSTSTTTTLPPPPIFSLLPFINSAEVSLCDAYSPPSHVGIDIRSSVEAEFQAICSGTYHKTKFHSGAGYRWQVNSYIEYSPTFSVWYTFEPFGGADDQAPADTQYDMLIADGTVVAAGDVLGRLLYIGDGAHVDFRVIDNFESPCPMPYFSAAASEEMLALWRLANPGQPICTDHNIY